MTSNFIWRDSIDPDVFHIGYRKSKRDADGEFRPIENSFGILASLHADMLHDMFGSDDWEQVDMRVRELPREVRLSLSLPLDMDYPVNEKGEPA
jgi:hypothetical protein